MPADLVHCVRLRENERGELVDVGYDLMISGRTIESDEELIRWAEKRDEQCRGRLAQNANHGPKPPHSGTT